MFEYLRNEKCTVNGDAVDEWMENLRVKENARHTDETKELLKKGKESSKITKDRFTDPKYNAHGHDNDVNWSSTFLWLAWVLVTACCATHEREFMWMCIAVNLIYDTLWTDWVRSCTIPTWACYLVVGAYRMRVYRASATDETANEPNDIESNTPSRRKSTRSKKSNEEAAYAYLAELGCHITPATTKKPNASKPSTKKQSKPSTKP